MGESVDACGISATTDHQQEVRNLQKCLRAGYHRIVHVCDHPKRRERIEALVSGQVPSADLSRIRYLSTRQFLGHLGELATTTIGKSEAAKGDKAAVVSSGPISPEDEEAEIKRMLAEIHARQARNNPPT